MKDGIRCFISFDWILKVIAYPKSAQTLVNEGFGVNTCSTLLIAEGFLLFLTSMGMGNYISDIRKY